MRLLKDSLLSLLIPDTFNAVLYSSDDPKCNDPRFSANFEKGHIYINCSKFCFVLSEYVNLNLFAVFVDIYWNYIIVLLHIKLPNICFVSALVCRNIVILLKF